MKNVLSIMCFYIGLVAIPIQIGCIINGERVLLYTILFLLTAPGFWNSVTHLYKKVNFSINLRLNE